MPGFFRTIRIIFRRHLFRVMRSRRMLIVLLLSCIPAVPVFVMMQRHPGASVDRVIIHASWLLLLQVIVPLVSLIAGSAVVSEEISDRTIGYVFTRPDGAPFHPGYFTQRLHLLIDRADLPPVRLQDLRHGAASLATLPAEDLVSIRDLAQRAWSGGSAE